MTLSGLTMTNLTSDPSKLEELSTYNSQVLVGFGMSPCVNVEGFASFGMAGLLGIVYSTRKLASILALINYQD